MFWIKREQLQCYVRNNEVSTVTNRHTIVGRFEITKPPSSLARIRKGQLPRSEITKSLSLLGQVVGVRKKRGCRSDDSDDPVTQMWQTGYFFARAVSLRLVSIAEIVKRFSRFQGSTSSSTLYYVLSLHIVVGVHRCSLFEIVHKTTYRMHRSCRTARMNIDPGLSSAQ